jgi:hypothetical protein
MRESAVASWALQSLPTWRSAWADCLQSAPSIADEAIAKESNSAAKLLEQPPFISDDPSLHLVERLLLPSELSE